MASSRCHRHSRSTSSTSRAWWPTERAKRFSELLRVRGRGVVLLVILRVVRLRGRVVRTSQCGGVRLPRGLTLRYVTIERGEHGAVGVRNRGVRDACSQVAPGWQHVVIDRFGEAELVDRVRALATERIVEGL